MHVIPGVDDGSTDLDMSLLLLLSDWDHGCLCHLPQQCL